MKLLLKYRLSLMHNEKIGSGEVLIGSLSIELKLVANKDLS